MTGNPVARSLVGCLLCGCVALAAAAETVEVRLEPFPPLVREDGSGLVVEQLRELAGRERLSLNIQVVSYSRAKYQLRNGQADLIGLIPLGRETDDFYGYARELDWRLETRADLFSANPEVLEGDWWRGSPVGTPWGNAAFFADLTGASRDRFVESSLGNLVEMMTRGRLPVLLFERTATLTMIEQLDDGVVYYRNLFVIPAGFAVQRNDAGRRLAELLNRALPPVDTSPHFRAWRRYLSLPESGRVSARPGDGLKPCPAEELARDEREAGGGDC